MKNFKFFVFLVLLSSVISSSQSAYAFNCKTSQMGNADECWTEVKIGDGFTTLVSRGHVLVVSIAGKAVADNDGYLARLSNASTDQEVLGVAQQNIATGAAALVMTRGRGVVKVANGAGFQIVSGDTLGVDASGTAVESTGTSHIGRANIATALEASSGTGAQNVNSYIYVD